MYVHRTIEKDLKAWLKTPKSLLIWGPRQTGKTTLIQHWLKEIRGHEIHQYNLQDPATRRKFEADPSLLKKELSVNPEAPKLIYIDEVQKVPELMDLIQLLIDENKEKMKFVLTGSSARKLRKVGGNLLPGRVLQKRLGPFSWEEVDWGKKNADILEEALIWGSLPEITQIPKKERGELLSSYVDLYLEQEIRAEALARNLGAFNRFLELAALGSGSAPNLTKISNVSGVSVTTVVEYYSILTDSFVAERLDPYIGNTRKRLLTTPRYYFFDVGIRNACAKLPMDVGILNLDGGRLFEHFVILEVLRRIRAHNLPWKTYFWRTSGGAEVDLVIDQQEAKGVIPIEIKFSKNISRGDIKGLLSFLEAYPNKVKEAFVIAPIDKPFRLEEKITVIPWYSFS